MKTRIVRAIRAVQRQATALTFGLRSLSASGQNAHHLARIGTGHQAAPSIGVGKAACMQVVNGCFYPGGAANQQDPHLLLAGCQRVKVERQNYRRGANFTLIVMLATCQKAAGNRWIKRNFSITAGKDRSQGLSKEAKSGLTER